ncbi:MAG TPA: ATP-binding cassette domain-containing protein [Intrasporangium sp.]|nr:ATP-binding cassette domain-containing protein [Intrasporangium sp.]
MTEPMTRAVLEDRAQVQQIRVRDLTVRFGDVVALDGVSCAATPGQVLAVTGPSGAGKSTLLWAMAGLLDEPPSARRVASRREAAGRQVASRRAGVIVQGTVASPRAGQVTPVLIPQGNGLASVLTAEENCLVPLVARGVPARQARARVGQALADVGLEESAGHLIEELSGGQQQRVAVARALAAHPTVLLADEPTSELDHTNRERVLGLLRGVAERGGIVVMATHDPEAALAADHEVHLDAGRLAPLEEGSL